MVLQKMLCPQQEAQEQPVDDTRDSGQHEEQRRSERSLRKGENDERGDRGAAAPVNQVTHRAYLPTDGLANVLLCDGRWCSRFGSSRSSPPSSSRRRQPPRNLSRRRPTPRKQVRNRRHSSIA